MLEKCLYRIPSPSCKNPIKIGPKIKKKLSNRTLKEYVYDDDRIVRKLYLYGNIPMKLAGTQIGPSLTWSILVNFDIEVKWSDNCMSLVHLGRKLPASG